MLVDKIIKETDFSYLYSKKNRLFSIGFDITNNILNDSYYDFLASEARQSSLIAIAKKDIKYKHWINLSRTLTETTSSSSNPLFNPSPGIPKALY